MQHDGELKYHKDMALYIKHEMEKKQQGSWHIIVGKKLFDNLDEMLLRLIFLTLFWNMISDPNIGTNFGSFVTYEHKGIILFWLEHIGFLLFKHGWLMNA